MLYWITSYQQCLSNLTTYVIVWISIERCAQIITLKKLLEWEIKLFQTHAFHCALYCPSTAIIILIAFFITFIQHTIEKRYLSFRSLINYTIRNTNLFNGKPVSQVAGISESRWQPNHPYFMVGVRWHKVCPWNNHFQDRSTVVACL